MGLVFKNLGKDNIQITPHVAHKQWDLSYAEANVVGIKSYKGSFIPGDFNISDPDVGTSLPGDGSTITKVVTAGGGYFSIDGAQAPPLTLLAGNTYKFDVSNASTSSHPFRFQKASDNSSWTIGVTISGTQGSQGAYVQIVVDQTTPSLKYYCTSHSGMGNNITISGGGGTYTELTTTDGYYQRLVHAGIDKLYYGSDTDSYNTFCNSDLSKQKKEFTDKVTVFSVPRQICGDNIHPGTFKIVSGSYKIVDDGNGNLIDQTDTTVYSDVKHDSAYVGIWEGYRYLNLGVQKEISLKIDSKFSLIGNARTVNFVEGKWGTGIEFTGKVEEDVSLNSRIELENSAQMDFDEDFTVAFWCKVESNQTHTQSYITNGGDGNSRILKNQTVNAFITKREWWGGHSPFDIRIYNQTHASRAGKVSVFRNSKASTTGYNNLVSDSTINDGNWHHVAFTKVGNQLKLYIDAVLEDTETDNAHDLVTRTSCNIFVGGRKYGKRRHDALLNKWVGENVIHPLTGKMDEIRLFDKGLSAAEVTVLHSSINNSNRVGNIMYAHGIATITTPSNTTKDLYHSSSVWDSLSFKGSQDVTEHLYLCNVLDGEYNSSFNNTLRVKQDPKEDTMQSYVTSSYFSPYVTTIGLYDDSGNLCAVAKLAQPVKNPSEYDTSYQIRFDTN